MTLLPNFTNSNNWELLGSLTGNATLIQVNGVDKILNEIGVLTFPLLVENKTLAISCEATYTRSRWEWGGKAQMIVNTGITVGGIGDSVLSEKSLTLNEIVIVRFPSLSNSYTLKIVVPYWYRDVTYRVYEYIGSGIADIEGKIDQVHTEVA